MYFPQIPFSQTALLSQSAIRQTSSKTKFVILWLHRFVYKLHSSATALMLILTPPCAMQPSSVKYMAPPCASVRGNPLQLGRSFQSPEFPAPTLLHSPKTSQPSLTVCFLRYETFHICTPGLISCKSFTFICFIFKIDLTKSVSLLRAKKVHQFLCHDWWHR